MIRPLSPGEQAFADKLQKRIIDVLMSKPQNPVEAILAAIGPAIVPSYDVQMTAEPRRGRVLITITENTTIDLSKL